MRTFNNTYSKFYKLREAAVNPLLMVWNLMEVAAKPFTHFYNEIFMDLNFQEAAVKPLAQLINEILIV